MVKSELVKEDSVLGTRLSTPGPGGRKRGHYHREFEGKKSVIIGYKIEKKPN